MTYINIYFKFLYFLKYNPCFLILTMFFTLQNASFIAELVDDLYKVMYFSNKFYL